MELNEELDHRCIQNNTQTNFPRVDPPNIPNESIVSSYSNPDSSNENIMHYCETPDTPSNGLKYQQLAPMPSSSSTQVMSYSMPPVTTQSNDSILSLNNNNIHYCETPDATSQVLKYHEFAPINGML